MPGQRNFIPSRPSGSSRFIRFCQAVWDRVFGPASHFISTTTVQVEQTERGIAFHAAPARRGTPAPASTTAVSMFRLKAMGTGNDANLLRCVDWDGSIEGTTVVWILKPYKLWNTSRWLVDNVDIFYAYSVDFIFRVASYSNPPFGDVLENQIIVPRYIVPYAAFPSNGRPAHAGDIIHAGKLKSPQSVNGKTIEYIDLNVDGRAWAKQRNP